MNWTPLRKPPGRSLAPRSVCDPAAGERAAPLGVEWVQRYSALRQRGLVMPLMIRSEDDTGYYVATNLVDLWGSKTFVSNAELRTRIEDLERNQEDHRAVNAA